MAFKAFLKIDSIKGESQFSDHEDEIDINGFDWGVDRHGFQITGGQRESGIASVRSMTIHKDLDAASTYLGLACLKAENLGTCVLSCRKDAGDPRDFLTIEMDNTLVENFSLGGQAGGGNPHEAITLNFSLVKVKFVEDADDLTGGTEHDQMTWDLLKGETA